ncbi:MAG TPA: prephenate dehydrogenase [Nitrososphaeraceae archaeon]|nr:prephenate dehydrogenase [Nitrososphaeraceae archaeon]
MKEIAVIGAGGRMGSWIIKYFLNNKNVRIKAYDKNMYSIERQLNIKIELDFNSCVRDSDIVFLCIPLKIIPQIIAECSKIMKRNSVLIDISSIKNKSFKSLSKIQNYISPICIHPMFGPGASRDERLKILFIPVRNYRKEFQIVKQLFQNFEILPIESATKHDHIMGVVLGLTHYMNIIFADVIASQQYKDLKFYAGNTFRIQCILSESILNDDTELLNSLFIENPFIKKELRNFHKKYLDYYQMINEKNDEKLARQLKNIKSSIEEHHDLNSSYVKMYQFVNLLCKEDKYKNKK